MTELIVKFMPTYPIRGNENYIYTHLIRECIQYQIHFDGFAIRWDIAWVKDGKRNQPYIIHEYHDAYDDVKKYAAGLREDARELLMKTIPEDAALFSLDLPQGVYFGKYV